MFVGAYWSSREESEDSAAARIVSCLKALSGITAMLARWYEQRGKKSAALRAPLEIDSARIKAKLVRNRRDSDGSPIMDLGFRFTAWNGSNASISVTIGACNKHVRNAVVLDLDEGVTLEQRDYLALIRQVVTTFDPDFAVVTNDEILARAKAVNPWEAGWFTYNRSQGLHEHVQPPGGENDQE